MAKAADRTNNLKRLPAAKSAKETCVTFGVCAACDPRIDADSRQRTLNIVEMVAGVVAGNVKAEGIRAIDDGDIDDRHIYFCCVARSGTDIRHNFDVRTV